jgi:tetratricopeptide (TPR) repeat protein
MPEGPTASEIQLRIRELLGRATLLRARGDRQQALKLAQEAAALDDESWEAHELIGDLLLDLDRAHHALESYRRAREIARHRPTLEEKIGRAAIARAAKMRSAELSQALLRDKARLASPPRKPAYAALFSFFVPGLGQVYNGELLKGFVLVVAYLVLFALGGITFRSHVAARPPSPMGSLYAPQVDVAAFFSALFSGPSAIWFGLLVVVWIYSIADAAIRAGRTMTSDDTGLV